MSQQPSGWYEDPQDATLLRYWDGVEWSKRTMPKVKPGLDHVGEARPYTPHQEPPRRDGAPREYPAHWGPESSGRPGGIWQGQHGYPVNAGAKSGQVAGLWRRFFAALLDRIIVAIVVSVCAVPFSGDVPQQFSDWWSQVLNAARSGSDTAPAMPNNVMQYFTTVAIVSTIVLIAYEILFTMTSGQTLGKRMLGIRVVHCDAAGTLKPGPEKVGLGPSCVRSLIKFSGDIIGVIPLIGQLSFVLPLAIIISGSGNPERRTIGDKAASTRVIRTK